MWWRCICIVGPKINALADEDQEQDPDRWCSHTAMGQEAWQIVSQWIWNLRLELGHQLQPDPVRPTEFAPALPPAHKESPEPPAQAPVQGYGPPAVALPWKAAASRGKILPSNRMARCAARRIRSFVLMSGAEKATAACVWSMQPAFAVVVIAPCASNVNGMAAPLRNPAR